MTALKTSQLLKAGVTFAQVSAPRAAGVLAAGCAAALLRSAGEWNGAVGLSALGGLAEVVFWVMAGAALTRLAFADEHPGDPAFRIGPRGFQWNRQEWRYLGANFVLGAALMLATLIPMVVGLVLALPFGVAAERPSGGARAIFLAGICCGLAVAAFVGVRLSLAPAASIAERRLTIPWSVTKGSFWPLFGAYGLILLLTIAGAVVLMLVGGFLNTAAGGWSEPRQQALATLATGVLAVLVQLPLTIGVSAAAYRILHGGGETAGAEAPPPERTL